MGKNWYENARVVLEDRILTNGFIGVENGIISDVGEGSPQRAGIADNHVDIQGQWLVPGFIDVHVHGGGGVGFMGPNQGDIAAVTEFHAKHGTTSLLATTSTASTEILSEAIERLAAYTQYPAGKGSRVVGIHVEGPFLSQKRKGAQDPRYIIPPNRQLTQRWLEAGKGTIRLMTIAPEIPGALNLIQELKQHGVTVGAGHTDATYNEALEGIRYGITHSIHTFNGMRPIHHRDPGVLGAVLSDDRVVCELIGDGHHVHPGTIRLLYKSKGPRKIALITDAVEVAGLPDGEYISERTSVLLHDGIVELTDGSSLAGSVLTMDQAYRNILSYLSISPVEASLMASTTPATSIGIGHKKGRIAVGMDADLTILDSQLMVIQTIVEGTSVYDRHAE